ncbi:MAG: type 2 isopentenyl-diphosphate Delta-isomerase [Candidatus Anstonellales archaeon]
MSIKKRKEDHIKISLDEGMQYTGKSLFEDVVLVHNSLPEMDRKEIDISYKFLGKTLSAPMMITAVTGGFEEAGRINRKLAETCETHRIALGLGSQRAMLEDRNMKETYYVKDVAPSIPVIGNIGGCQLKNYSIKQIEDMVNGIEADALAVHLNPLQESIQREGDKNWKGVLSKIEELVMDASFPVIVKETGAGISFSVAWQLKEAGVGWVDVAGKGGTSWSRIEYARGGEPEGFEEWGIPTALSILMCKGVVKIIASGGIRSGVDGAKAIALGAEMFGGAYPFLKALYEKRLEEEIEKWKMQFRNVLFLTGSENIAAFKKRRYFIKGELKELAGQI